MILEQNHSSEKGRIIYNNVHLEEESKLEGSEDEENRVIKKEQESFWLVSLLCCFMNLEWQDQKCSGIYIGYKNRRFFFLF